MNCNYNYKLLRLIYVTGTYATQVAYEKRIILK
jgi:hypothetical protein